MKTGNVCGGKVWLGLALAVVLAFPVTAAGADRVVVGEYFTSIG